MSDIDSNEFGFTSESDSDDFGLISDSVSVHMCQLVADTRFLLNSAPVQTGAQFRRFGAMCIRVYYLFCVVIVGDVEMWW